MPRNKKKQKKKTSTPEPPEEMPDYTSGHVGDDYVVLQTDAPSRPLLLRTDTIDSVELIQVIDGTFSYCVRCGKREYPIVNTHPIHELAEILFPSELPDWDEDPWDQHSARRRGRAKS